MEMNWKPESIPDEKMEMNWKVEHSESIPDDKLDTNWKAENTRLQHAESLLGELRCSFERGEFLNLTVLCKDGESVLTNSLLVAVLSRLASTTLMDHDADLLMLPDVTATQFRAFLDSVITWGGMSEMEGIWEVFQILNIRIDEWVEVVKIDVKDLEELSEQNNDNAMTHIEDNTSENNDVQDNANDLSDMVDDEILDSPSSFMHEEEDNGEDTDLKKFSCQQPGCSNSFNQLRLLKRHMKLFHQMSNLHRCGFCNKVCKSATVLQRHINRHKILANFSCDDCQQNFDTLEDLRKHCEVIHGNANENNDPSSGLTIVVSQDNYFYNFQPENVVVKNDDNQPGLANPENILRMLESKKNVVEIFEGSEDILPNLDMKNEDPIKVIKAEDTQEKNQPDQESLRRHHNRRPKGAKMHQCDVCKKAFPTPSTLKLHTNVHTGDKPFKCRYPGCDKAFSQPPHLKVHERTHTGARPHMCSICGKTFAVASNMKKHAQIHERNEGTLQEEPVQDLNIVSPSEFTETADPAALLTPADDVAASVVLHKEFTTPIEVNPASRVNVCEFCGKQFTKKKDLQNHVKTHNELLPFPCTECHEKFATMSKLKIHEKIHTGEAGHSCGQCGRKCVSASALAKHMYTHTGEKPHQCKICNKSFTQKSHANYHLKTVHGDKMPRARKHFCYECGKGFTASGTLKKHMMLHSNNRPYGCDFCSKTYVQKSHAKIHMLKHTGARPYLCLECGKTFLTKTHMKEHTKIHTGEKKVYFCKECGTQYSGMHDLRVHLRKHSGDTPYPCTKCTKKFRSARSLEAHLRIHLGVKPFKCQNCGKCFSAPSGLRQHFKRHDTCRLTAAPGAYSIKPDQLLQVPDKPLSSEVGEEVVLAEINPVLIAGDVEMGVSSLEGGVVLGEGEARQVVLDTGDARQAELGRVVLGAGEARQAELVKLGTRQGGIVKIGVRERGVVLGEAREGDIVKLGTRERGVVLGMAQVVEGQVVMDLSGLEEEGSIIIARQEDIQHLSQQHRQGEQHLGEGLNF